MAATASPLRLVRTRHTLDASHLTLGRLSSLAVRYLTGKHKPEYRPNVDLGDFVTIVNAVPIRLSGRKRWRKIYIRMSGYPGGIRRRSLRELEASKPADLYRHAISGMLPNDRHRQQRLRRLTVTR